MNLRYAISYTQLAFTNLFLQSALIQISQKIPGRMSIWEADEIDVALYADVLVTVYRFLSPDESVPLIKEWLEPTRSDAVKICAVRACLTLAQEVCFSLLLPLPILSTYTRSLVSHGSILSQFFIKQFPNAFAISSKRSVTVVPNWMHTGP